MNSVPLLIACAAISQLTPQPVAPPSPQAFGTSPAVGDSLPPQFRADTETAFGRSNSIFDSPRTRQAAAEVPIQPTRQTSTTAALARMCTAQLSELPDSERRDAESMTLLELLAHPQRMAPPSRAVARYWDLAIATGDYRFAVREEHFLSQLPRPASQYEDALLTAELTAAQARQQQARLNVLARQQALNESAPPSSAEVLPWPSDPPLVGRYRTRIDTLFAGQLPPARLQQIDQALPKLQRQIELQSAAVAAAQSMVETLLRGTQDVERLIEAHHRLRLQRREFLQAVHKYNRQVAEYALSVTGSNTAPATLVATLINTPDGSLAPIDRTATRQDGPFRPR